MELPVPLVNFSVDVTLLHESHLATLRLLLPLFRQLGIATAYNSQTMAVLELWAPVLVRDTFTIDYAKSVAVLEHLIAAFSVDIHPNEGADIPAQKNARTVAAADANDGDDGDVGEA